MDYSFWIRLHSDIRWLVVLAFVIILVKFAIGLFSERHIWLARYAIVGHLQHCAHYSILARLGCHHLALVTRRYAYQPLDTHAAYDRSHRCGG